MKTNPVDDQRFWTTLGLLAIVFGGSGIVLEWGHPAHMLAAFALLLLGLFEVLFGKQIAEW